MRSYLKKPSDTQRVDLFRRVKFADNPTVVEFEPNDTGQSPTLNDASTFQPVYFSIYSEIKKLPEKTEDNIRIILKKKWNELTPSQKCNTPLDFHNIIGYSRLVDNEWVVLTAQQRQEGILSLLNEWIESFIDEQVTSTENHNPNNQSRPAPLLVPAPKERSDGRCKKTGCCLLYWGARFFRANPKKSTGLRTSTKPSYQ